VHLHIVYGDKWLETWQSSLLYVFVCYFEGWPAQKPGKIQEVVNLTGFLTFTGFPNHFPSLIMIA